MVGKGPPAGWVPGPCQRAGEGTMGWHTRVRSTKNIEVKFPGKKLRCFLREKVAVKFPGKKATVFSVEKGYDSCGFELTVR